MAGVTVPKVLRGSQEPQIKRYLLGQGRRLKVRRRADPSRRAEGKQTEVGTLLGLGVSLGAYQAFRLGEVTEPVKTQFGYHLILVQERAPRSFEVAQAEIAQRIRPEMGQKAIDALKAKTPVTYDNEYFGKK